MNPADVLRPRYDFRYFLWRDWSSTSDVAEGTIVLNGRGDAVKDRFHGGRLPNVGFQERTVSTCADAQRGLQTVSEQLVGIEHTRFAGSPRTVD